MYSRKKRSTNISKTNDIGVPNHKRSSAKIRVSSPYISPVATSVTHSSVNMGLDADQIIQGLEDATQKALESNPESRPKEVEIYIKSINDKITEKATKDQLAQEIKALSDSSLKIEESFHSIENTLGHIVEEGAPGVVPAMQEDLENLFKRWKELRETYVDALWDSREIAGSACTIALDFVDIFLVHLQSLDTIEQQKEEIMDYIETINKQEAQSRQFSDAFKNLAFDVAAFQQDWRGLITKNAEKYSNEQIEALTRQIGDLEAKLSTILRKITGYTIAAGVLVTTAAVTGVVGIWFPVTWIGTLTAAMGSLAVGALLFSAQNERDIMLRDIQTKTEDRAKIENTLKAVELLDAGLLASKDDFKSLSEKLGALASVWALIKSDLQMIEGKLDMALSDPDSKSLYKTRLQNATVMYGVLAKGLREYQISVVLPKKR